MVLPYWFLSWTTASCSPYWGVDRCFVGKLPVDGACAHCHEGPVHRGGGL
jgi:hypothetical protein